MREFWNWAVRDNAEWKIKYFWFRHPLAEHSFGKYMLKHQIQADWTMRDAKNWWWGWEEDVSLDSMSRHLEDLLAIHSWYYVYKIRTENWEETKVSINKIAWLEDCLVSKEDCYNAVRFNASSGLLQYLRENEQN